MTQPRKDDWHKPRTKGQHLTADEIAQIKAAYIAGHRPEYAARELQCSSRVVMKYYAQFRDGHRPVIVERFRPMIQHRRYHKSNIGA